MVIIGWLSDHFNDQSGGAELTERSWQQSCPANAGIVYCPPTKRPPEVDVFYVGNCTTYGDHWIEELAKRPVAKMVHDPWWHGAPILRRWLLDNTSLLMFHSPVQVERFDYPFDLHYELVPDAVDTTLFMDAAQENREGNVYVAHCAYHKGLHNAIDWSLCNDEELDLYGGWGMGFRPGELPSNVRYHGKVDYVKVPGILGKAKRLIFMPVWTEPYGRVVVEASAAGCEMVLGGDIGCLWWMEHRPEDMARSNELFWSAMGAILG